MGVLSILNSNNNIVRLLQKENDKLREDLLKAQRELSEISRYKDDYESIIKEAKDLRDSYKKLNAKYEKLFTSAKKKIDSMTK